MRKAALLFFAALFCCAGVAGSAAGAEGSGAAASSQNTKSKKTGEKAHVSSTADSYIGFDPIYTTVLNGDVTAGTLMVGIGLDVPDPALRKKVLQMQPQLRDIYVRNMLVYTALGVRPWQQPDAIAIADLLQQATDRRLKRKGARILLAQVAMRLSH